MKVWINIKQKPQNQNNLNVYYIATNILLHEVWYEVWEQRNQNKSHFHFESKMYSFLNISETERLPPLLKYIPFFAQFSILSNTENLVYPLDKNKKQKRNSFYSKKIQCFYCLTLARDILLCLHISFLSFSSVYGLISETISMRRCSQRCQTIISYLMPETWPIIVKFASC